MKFATVSKSLVMGLALLLASSAFAGTKATLDVADRGDRQRYQAESRRLQTAVGRQRPQRGSQHHAGQDVSPKFRRRWSTCKHPHNDSAELLKSNDDGTKTLAGARFEGKKFALEIGDASDQMQAGSSK
jgi:hypothetical protein